MPGMQGEPLKAWRKAQRQRLVASRMAIDAATIGRWRHAIDAHLLREFPVFAGLTKEGLALQAPASTG